MNDNNAAPQQALAPYFPPFADNLMTALASWQQLMAMNPDYLSHPDCPYTPEQVELLDSIFSKAGLKKTQDEQDESLDLDEAPDIEKESIRLFNKMKTFQNSLRNSDTSEMATTFRTMVSLMEKILAIKERAEGVNNYSKFKTLILDSLDRYLEPSQRAEFVDKLKDTLQEM